MPTRKIGTNATVFTLGGSAFIGDLVNGVAEITVATQEGKGIADTDNYPVPVGRSMRITGELEVSGSVVLMGTANSSTPTVTFAATTGAGTYSGTAVISSISHRFEREGIQTFSVTLDSQGAVTVTT